jgi:hypothetical protein
MNFITAAATSAARHLLAVERDLCGDVGALALQRVQSGPEIPLQLTNIRLGGFFGGHVGVGGKLAYLWSGATTRA